MFKRRKLITKKTPSPRKCCTCVASKLNYKRKPEPKATLREGVITAQGGGGLEGVGEKEVEEGVVTSQGGMRAGRGRRRSGGRRGGHKTIISLITDKILQQVSHHKMSLMHQQ